SAIGCRVPTCSISPIRTRCPTCSRGPSRPTRRTWRRSGALPMASIPTATGVPPSAWWPRPPPCSTAASRGWRRSRSCPACATCRSATAWATGALAPDRGGRRPDRVHGAVAGRPRCSAGPPTPPPPMPHTRIFSRASGRGLMRDLGLVSSLLAAAGHEVEPVAFGKEKGLRNLRLSGMWLAQRWRGPPDVQIALEHVYPRSFRLARRNLLVPNPEWFRSDYHDSLPAIDVMLCKTRHAHEIFSRLGCDARFIGFTSEDRCDPAVPRRREFLNLAGRSPVKGTEVVLDAWRRHPEWPRLVVVQSPRHARPGPPAPNIDHRIGRFDDGELRCLQNACLFHICPSEAEGFG